jgi:hypothetical protein
MKKLLSAVAITAMMSVAPAMAQSNSLGSSTQSNNIISNPGKLIYNYDAENIIPVLQELGFQWEGRTGPNNQRVVLATANNGLKFVMLPTACTQGASAGCVGVNMMAVFDGYPDQRTVNSFNYRYSFASAGLSTEGAAFLSRYEIADYGVPRGNLAVSIVNYVALAEMFQRTLGNASKTVSNDSYVGDMAANSLNMQALFEDKGLAEKAGVARDTHSVSFEEAADFAAVLIKAEEKNPGKIMNFVGKPKK